MSGRSIACVVALLAGFLACGGAGMVVHAQSATDDFDGPHRPQYHLTSDEEWMSDPTGLIYDDGMFHFFHIGVPPKYLGVRPRHWGHARSRDLVHWEHLPRAVSGPIMSGSIVYDEDNSSGFGSDERPPWVAILSMVLDVESRVQSQGLAYSLDDGMTWIKYVGNPVIDIGSTEFRDPQVFRHEPDDRWVMVVALAEERKVRFYSSVNLKDWDHLSDFGPAGARNGAWECPDLFSLQVDGDPERTKWVLQVDVQPVNGQYFVGHFDGTEFTLDSDFAEALNTTPYEPPPGRVIEDFEGEDYGDWTVEGEAFGERPATGTFDGQSRVTGFLDDGLVNTFIHGDEPQGSLTSPQFTVDAPYINFLIGGGNHPREVGMKLLLDGEPVRWATGANTETLSWKSWDVSELLGRDVRIRIFDFHSGGWGHINVDHIMQADEPARAEREHALWVDYGMDFYAVRSWRNVPEEDGRRIWIAWMGNWMYAHDVPTEEWKGVQSIPRAVELQTFPEGVRLVQRPVHELQQLRADSFTLSDLMLDGELDLTAKYGVSGTELEIIVEFEPIGAEEVGLKVRMGDDEETTVGYDVASETVFVDRTNSGKTDFNEAFAGRSVAPAHLEDGRLRFHVFVDRSTIEVFVNEGRTVVSNLIYPDRSSGGVEIFSRGGEAHLHQVDIYRLKSIWK